MWKILKCIPPAKPPLPNSQFIYPTAHLALPLEYLTDVTTRSKLNSQCVPTNCLYPEDSPSQLMTAAFF